MLDRRDGCVIDGCVIDGCAKDGCAIDGREITDRGFDCGARVTPCATRPSADALLGLHKFPPWRTFSSVGFFSPFLLAVSRSFSRIWLISGFCIHSVPRFSLSCHQASPAHPCLEYLQLSPPLSVHRCMAGSCQRLNPDLTSPSSLRRLARVLSVGRIRLPSASRGKSDITLQHL